MMEHLPLLLCTACTLATAAAEIPSLINYQGRLVNADGSAPSGQKSFLLQVFDAANGGTLLYREEIGAVNLGDNGVYSFQFGGAGSSESPGLETVATTDGTLTVFNNVLTNTPTGGVTISDGTYTWTSGGGGSSSPADFLGNYDVGSQTVSAIYLSGAPTAGQTITVSYQFQTNGIMPALSRGAQHWLQLTINGAVQSPRERILTVPFASVAQRALGADTADNISGFDLQGIQSMVYELYERTGSVAGRNFGNAYTIGNADFRPSDWISSISTPVYDLAWSGDGPRNVSFQIVTNATNAFINSLSVTPTFRYSSRTRPWWVIVNYSDDSGLSIPADQLPVDPNAPTRRLWQNPTPDLLVRSMIVETRDSATTFSISVESVIQTVPGKSLNWNFSLPDRFKQRLRLRTSWSGNWDWKLYQTTDAGDHLVFESSEFEQGPIDKQFERISGSDFSLRVVEGEQRTDKTLSFGALHFYQE